MRVKTTMLTEGLLMYCIAGQLYEQAPGRKPRKADIILQKVQEKIREHFYCPTADKDFRMLWIPEEDLKDYIDILLKNIPEFQELNLSQNEYEAGVKVDDTRLSQFKQDDWRTDFIDLDAFVRNVFNRMRRIYQAEQDCMGCKEDGSPEHREHNMECLSCKVNPAHSYRYNDIRKPQGKRTFACKFTCPQGAYSCCEECGRAASCNAKCDGNSATCGNAINHKEKI